MSGPLARARVTRPEDGALAFRLATAVDALTLHALATQVFLDTYATEGIRPSLAREVAQHFSSAAWLAQMARPEARIVVVEQAGHLVAFAQLSLGQDHPLVGDAAAAERDAELVRQAYLPFLRSCPLAVRMPGGVLACHSVPEGVDRTGFDISILDRTLSADDYQEHGPVFELVWGRDYRSENAAAFAKLARANVLVNGHEPCPDGFRVPNDRQIILDCCGERTSYLLLPVGEPLSHAQLVERIRPLPAAGC
jgi:hypothetical protein